MLTIKMHVASCGNRAMKPARLGLEARRSLRLALCPARLLACTSAATADAVEVSSEASFSEDNAAVVSSLFGRPRWGRNNCVVPVLTPEHGLPFGLSLEIIASENTATPHSSQEKARGRLLDLCYVLSGSGQICTEDGGCRDLRAGDALLAWHGTTYLQSSREEPLSVLRFHLPSHLLARSEPPASCFLSDSELQEIIENFHVRHSTIEGECFSLQDANEIMQAAKAQARKGISKLYKDDVEVLKMPSAQLNRSMVDKRQMFHHMLLAGPWSGVVDALKEQLSGLFLSAGFVFPVCDDQDEHVTSREAWVSRRAEDQGSLLNNVISFTSWGGSSLTLQAVASKEQGSTHRAGAGEELVVSSFDEERTNADRRASNSKGLSIEKKSSCSRDVGISGSSCSAGGSNGETGYFASSAAFEGNDTGCLLMQRAMEHFRAFRFPHQTNRLAFVFDPSEIDLSVSFGIEVFEPGHRTPVHVHPNAHEVFFCLAGHGEAYCDGERAPVNPGDVIAFPPKSKHALDNLSDSKLYCLQLMAPNEQFVEYVKSGEHVGRLSDDDLCTLTNMYC